MNTSLKDKFIEEKIPQLFEEDENDYEYPNYDLGWKEGHNKGISTFESNLLEGLKSNS